MYTSIVSLIELGNYNFESDSAQNGLIGWIQLKFCLVLLNSSYTRFLHHGRT